jgi:hypothetical protein
MDGCAQHCPCFPGLCRGGQVVDGKLANGLECRELRAQRQPIGVVVNPADVESPLMRAAARPGPALRATVD